MKCPFKTDVIITRNIKKLYQYPYDRIRKEFLECEKDDCMAYDKENERCMKILNK